LGFYEAVLKRGSDLNRKLGPGCSAETFDLPDISIDQTAVETSSLPASVLIQKIVRFEPEGKPTDTIFLSEQT
jgi:hypothetical protein